MPDAFEFVFDRWTGHWFVRGPEGRLELSVLTTLSRHVERLFWSFGLYCWPGRDGLRCIVSDQSFLPPKLS